MTKPNGEGKFYLSENYTQMNQSELLTHADTQYDSALGTLPELCWMPWIGENYNQHRVLIMAESCYDDSGYDESKQWMEGNKDVYAF